MYSVDWPKLKSFVDAKNLNIQFVELTDKYIMKAFDGLFCLDTAILKTSPVNADQTDFENNYKNDSNKPLALGIETFVEKRNYSGKIFAITTALTAVSGTADTSFCLLDNTSSNKIIKVYKILVGVETGKTSEISIWINGTKNATPGGTLKTPVNLYLGHANQSSSTVRVLPTMDSKGTLIRTTSLSAPNETKDIWTSESYIIIPPTNNLLISVKNAQSGTRTHCDVLWIEE